MAVSIRYPEQAYKAGGFPEDSSPAIRLLKLKNVHEKRKQNERVTCTAEDCSPATRFQKCRE